MYLSLPQTHITYTLLHTYPHFLLNIHTHSCPLIVTNMYTHIFIPSHTHLISTFKCSSIPQLPNTHICKLPQHPTFIQHISSHIHPYTFMLIQVTQMFTRNSTHSLSTIHMFTHTSYIDTFVYQTESYALVHSQKVTYTYFLILI